MGVGDGLPWGLFVLACLWLHRSQHGPRTKEISSPYGRKGSLPHAQGADSEYTKQREVTTESTPTKGDCPLSPDWTGDPDPTGHAAPLAGLHKSVVFVSLGLAPGA